MKLKGENMSYSIDDLKNVLKEIKGNLMDIIYTEHYLQKVEHRLIDIDAIERKLLEESPDNIKKFSNSQNYFALTFKSDGGDVCVVVEIFNLSSLILISAVCGG